jgi:phosphatidylserine decarboxylase
VTGRITGIEYQPGKFLLANQEPASALNEQNTLTIESEDNTRVVVKQIAGLIARRIVCHKQVGEAVQKGERFGLIKFGSRMDVLLGSEWSIQVRPGDKVKGGSSVLAQKRG